MSPTLGGHDASIWTFLSTTGRHKDASLRYQGATAAPPDDTARARASQPPLVAQWTRAAPRGAPPSPSYTENPDGGGIYPWLTRTRTRARARRLRVLACNTPNAGAVPRHEASPYIRNAHRRAMRTSSVVVLASRPRAASNGHRSGGYHMLGAVAAEEYARADDIFCW